MLFTFTVLTTSHGNVLNSHLWVVLTLSCAAVYPVRVWGSTCCSFALCSLCARRKSLCDAVIPSGVLGAILSWEGSAAPVAMAATEKKLVCCWTALGGGAVTLPAPLQLRCAGRAGLLRPVQGGGSRSWGSGMLRGPRADGRSAHCSWDGTPISQRAPLWV